MQLNIYPSQYIYTGIWIITHSNGSGHLRLTTVCSNIILGCSVLTANKQSRQRFQIFMLDFRMNKTWLFTSVWIYHPQIRFLRFLVVLSLAFCLQCRFRKNMLISVEEAYGMKADILFKWLCVNFYQIQTTKSSPEKCIQTDPLNMFVLLIHKSLASTREFSVGALNFIFQLQKRENVQFYLNFNSHSACRNYCTPLFLIATNTSEWKKNNTDIERFCVQRKHSVIGRCVCVFVSS